MRNIKDWTLLVTMPNETEKLLVEKAVSLGISPDQLLMVGLEWIVKDVDSVKKAKAEWKQDGKPDFGIRVEWVPNYKDIGEEGT